MESQRLREIFGPIFFSLLSLYDRDAEGEAVGMLKSALASGGVTDPVAKDVLRSIVFASEVSREREHA